MEPWARFGKRCPGLSLTAKKKSSQYPGGHSKRLSDFKDRGLMFQIISAIKNFGLSMNHIPFYRQRGQR